MLFLYRPKIRAIPITGGQQSQSQKGLFQFWEMIVFAWMKLVETVVAICCVIAVAASGISSAWRSGRGRSIVNTV